MSKYRDYLKGSRWRKIRKRVFARDSGKCRSCGQRASQVHHGSYDPATMRGDRIDRLYALCGACHEAVSLDVFGLKRPFAEVRKTTLLLDQPTQPAPKPSRKRKHQKKPKKHRQRLSIEEIRALSQRYAEGKMR